MTPELRRVLALPQAPAYDAAQLARVWTECLRKPSGTMQLEPVQGLALEHLYAQRGLYLSASVGAGKTLFAWLAFALLDAERGAFVAPAGLLEQVERMWGDYAEHWHGPPAMPALLSYEQLDRDDAIGNYDAFVLDECHSLRRWKRAATRVLHRPCMRTPTVCMTATPGRQSIMDHWHQLRWALGDGAPVPRTREEATNWAAALDHGGRDYASPGVLADLGGAGRSKVARARDWYRRRLASTPGVVIHSADSCDKALTIRHVLPPADPLIEQDFRLFREELRTPGGDFVSDALEAYRLELELGAGYYGIWDPAPPQEWLDARREWFAFVRAHAKGKLYTAARVARAYPDAAARWRKVRPRYRIAPRAVWRSDSVVRWAADWARQHAPCLVWSWSVPLCAALADATGLPWYGEEGRTAAGLHIDALDPQCSAVVSGQANLQGRNLQGWNKALYLVPPQSAQWLEQAFGRMHRQRQLQDVEIHIGITSARVLSGFDTAISESEFGTQAWGADQKIRRAEILRCPSPVGTYRWL